MSTKRGSAPKPEPWGWYLLFLIPFVGTLFPQFYNSVAPTLGGIPFFYWYQLLWVVVSGLLTALVYAVVR